MKRFNKIEMFDKNLFDSRTDSVISKSPNKMKLPSAILNSDMSYLNETMEKDAKMHFSVVKKSLNNTFFPNLNKINKISERMRSGVVSVQEINNFAINNRHRSFRLLNKLRNYKNRSTTPMDDISELGHVIKYPYKGMMFHLSYFVSRC